MIEITAALIAGDCDKRSAHHFGLGSVELATREKRSAKVLRCLDEVALAAALVARQSEEGNVTHYTEDGSRTVLQDLVAKLESLRRAELGMEQEPPRDERAREMGRGRR